MSLAIRIRGTAAISPQVPITGTTSIGPIIGSVDIDTSMDIYTGGELSTGLAIYVDGYEVERERIVSLSVSKNLDQTINKWALALRIVGPGGYYFRNPLQTYAASIGKANVNIVLRTKKGQRVSDRQLITRGVARSWTVQYPIETISGDDAAGRIDSRLINIVLAAGSGITRRQLIVTALESVGETQIEIDGYGGIINSPSDNLDQDCLSFCANEAASIGRVLLYNESGSITWVKIGTRGAVATATLSRHGSINPFVSLSASGPQSIITDLTLTGSEAIIDSAAATVDDSIKISPPVRSEVREEFALPTAIYTQASDCTTSVALSPPVPRKQLKSVTLAWQVTRGGVLTSEVNEEYGWLLDEVARYQQGLTDRACIPGVFLLDTGDTAPAFTAPWPRWALLRRVTTYHYWDSPGLQRASPDAAQPWGGRLSTVSGSKLKLGTISETEEWYHVRRAIKVLSPGTPWESTPVTTGLFMLGSGEGIASSVQLFGVTTRAITIISSESGFTRSVVTYNQTLAHYPGGAFLFADQTAGGSEEETMLISSRAETVYSPVNDTTFSTLSRTVDALSPLEKLLGDETRVAGPGAGPATDRIPEPVSTAGDAGSSSGGQLIKAHVIASGLEKWSVKREVKTQSQGAENQSEIETESIERIEESSAIPLQAELLPGIYLSPGTVVNMIDHEIGLNRRAQLHGIDLTMTNDFKVSALFKVYPE